MKGSVRRSILMVAIVCLVALPGFAQEPEMVFVWEDHVNADRVADNDAGYKKMVSVATKAKHPYPWSTYARDDMVYYIVTPVADWADVEKLGAAWEKLMTTVPPQLMRDTEGTTEFGRPTIWMVRPDLSYTPGHTGGRPGETAFPPLEFLLRQTGSRAADRGLPQEIRRNEQGSKQQTRLDGLCRIHGDRYSGVCVGRVCRERGPPSGRRSKRRSRKRARRPTKPGTRC